MVLYFCGINNDFTCVGPFIHFENILCPKIPKIQIKTVFLSFDTLEMFACDDVEEQDSSRVHRGRETWVRTVGRR